MTELLISIDGMGGDGAPDIVVGGLAEASARHSGARFVVFGDEARLRPLIARHPSLEAACEVVHTTDAVQMADKPSQALRRGRSTSMWLAIDAVRQGRAKVAVSSGNTGALMAMAKFQLRTVAGVERPAIAAIWPTMKAETIVLDMGANVDADERQLVDFAIMGAEFARAVFGVESPSVGLLNMGVEELKGNERVRAAAQMLRDAEGLPMRFHGFVEGDEIAKGTVDVVVTDGFTGNVALKTAEGTARLIASFLRAALTRTLAGRLAALLARGAFSVFREKIDPRKVNGGVFLGLNGLVVKSHGGTDATGFAAAIDLAVDMARADVATSIARDVSRLTFGVPVTDGGADTDGALRANENDS